MKLGLNMPSAWIVETANLDFAKQLGCEGVVVNYPSAAELPSAVDGYWSHEDLKAIADRVGDAGLEVFGVENFPVDHWDQVLMDGPERDRQIENLKRTITNMGRAGIPVMGYYFSLAGVWRRVERGFARGGGVSVGYLEDEAPPQTPLRRSEVWGVPRQLPEAEDTPVGTVTVEEMWDRLGRFLADLVPVAEEAGVKLAAHPDDPPFPELRGTGRLVYRGDLYQRLLDLVPSDSNCLEFCQGTISEMRDTDVYETIRRYAPTGRIAYVHFRNVKGKVPNYREVFLDEGDVDMFESLRAYRDSGYDGPIVPDHTPATSCAAPWHAGMAFALGYMKAALTAVQAETAGVGA